MSGQRKRVLSLITATAFALLLGPILGGADLGGAPRLGPSLARAAGTPVTIDGLTSTAPERWKEVPNPGPMRFKQFVIPREKGDAHDADLIIFFFGAGQGGAVDANLDRWKKQFQAPEGKTIDQLSKVETKQIGKVKTTILDVRGTYMYKASMMAPGDPEPRQNNRMIAVVFESPQGPYFFRFVGPEKTVEKNKKDFDKWLKGFK